MARVDFSWISGLADPLIEAAKQQQAANLVADFYASQNKPVASAAMPAGNLGAPVAAPSPFSDTPVAKVPAFAAIQGNEPKARMAGLIQSAAQKYGVDPDALVRVAQVESGLNPSAKNPNSSAGGLGQFIDSTWAQYGGGANKFDPNANADALARLARDNAAGLKQTLGRDPTSGELYLAHQQGLGGATKLLTNPQARAVDVVGERAVRLNGGTPDMTAGQFASLWSRKVGDQASAPAAVPQTAPAPVSTPAAGREAISPQLMALLRNPLTASFAQREIENLSKGREFITVGDKGYWVDKRRQTVTEVPGVGKPVQWSYHQQPDGGQIAFNPQTREVQVLKQGGTWRPATQEERQAFGTPANTGLAIGPNNQPKTLQGTVPSNKPQDAYDVEVSKADAANFVELNKTARAAGAQLDSLKGMERLMKDPNFYSGFGGELSKQTKRALSALGIKDADAAKAQEAFSALSNTLVLDAAGGSLGAQISNTDRDFIKEAGPALTHTQEGNQEIINIKRKTLERQQEVARRARIYAKENGGRLDVGFDDFLERWREENPLFSKEEMERIAAVAAQAPAPPPAIRYDADRKRIAAPPPPAPSGPAVIRYDSNAKRIP